jgi:hypothetical protein
LEILHFGGFLSMEPFGLFQFLQTLLSPSENTHPAETENPPLEATQPQPQKAENSTAKTSNENTYLRFLDTHEKRVRDTKKR